MADFVASWPGICLVCDGPINRGQLIRRAVRMVPQAAPAPSTAVRSEQGYAHAGTCPELTAAAAADAQALRSPICPRCTGRHPGEC